MGELLESLSRDLIGPETTPGWANLELSGRSLRFLFWPCLDRPLSGLSEGMHTRTGRPSSGQHCPLSKTPPPKWVRRILPILCSSLGRTDPRMVCPRHEKSCLLRSGLGSTLSWGFDPSGTDGPLTHSDDREGSVELVSFPSSRTTDICLWLNRSLQAIWCPPETPVESVEGEILKTDSTRPSVSLAPLLAGQLEWCQWSWCSTDCHGRGPWP